MARIILKCRDADMMGPFCDFVTDKETFDEAIREMHVHAKTHHEHDLTDEEIQKLRKSVESKSEKM